jgi:hypothetical protein
MNDLILDNAEKHLTLYRGMCSAIATCHHIDECKDIIDKSVALAAYYKQIEDDATVQMFYEVRLRAWRRIGTLFAEVDISQCETQTAKYKTIRAAFDERAMRGISDSRIIEIVRLSALSDADFEYAIAQELSNGSINEVMQKTPAAEAAREEARVRFEEARAKPPPKPSAAEIEREKKEKEEFTRIERHLDELEAASAVAMKEIGITLERKDRSNMKSVVFLIKDEVHAVMRQAAFDQRITMQEILRRGLKMWLIAHDYKWPEE